MRKMVLGCILALGLVVSAGHAQETVRVGYLHTLAVDGQFWTAIDNGLFEEQGLDVEPVQFNSGIPLSQALSGGSVDVAIMGAVISNFPSRGVGQVFLTNNIEAGTAMIYVDPDSGIESVEDLEGAEIATTQGTTAHVMLATALQQNGIDPNAANVVNMDMAAAVSTFVNGGVPAVATWWPFNAQIEANAPDAELLTTAGEYYPDAAIMGGWIANSNYYENNRDVLVRITRAWLEANDMLENDTDAVLTALQENHYPELEVEDLQEGFELLRTFDNEGWHQRWQDGTVTDWIGQVEQVFVDIGALEDFVDPSEFVDDSIFLEAYEAWSE